MPSGTGIARSLNVQDIGTRFTPKRGRPSAAQVMLIDQAVLTAARTLFFDIGYDAVAMENVAAAAGVSKGTLYARYPSKETLFIAVVEASIREWSAKSPPAARFPSTDIGERLRFHARVIAESLTYPEVRAFQRLLIANRERFPELARVMYDLGYSYIVDLLTDEIEAAAARDAIPARDAHGVAQLIVSAITGWQLQEAATRDPTREEIEAFAMRTVDLLVASRPAW